IVLPEIEVDPAIEGVVIRLLIEAALPRRLLPCVIVGRRRRYQLEIWDDRRSDRHAGRQERAAPRRQAWHRLDESQSEMFAQALESPEEKRVVRDQRPANRSAVLVAVEGWLLDIEVVLLVQPRVAPVLEHRPVERIRARFGRDVEHTPRRAPV